MRPPMQSRLAWVPLASLVLGAFLLSSSCSELSAAIQYWDVNGATAGASNTAVATGTWDTTTTNWTGDSTGSTATVVWTDGNTAIFSAGSPATATGTFTVTVSGTRPVAGLTINTGTITMATGVVSLGTSAMTISSGATLITASNTVITASTGSTWTLNGGTLATSTTSDAAPGFYVTAPSIVMGTGGGTLSNTVAGHLVIINNVISGTSFTMAGVGTLALATTATYTGATLISSGELRLRGSVTNRLPVGTDLTVNSPGILNINGSAQNQTVASLSGNGIVMGAGGTLTVNGSASTTFSGTIVDTATATSLGGIYYTTAFPAAQSGNGRLAYTGTGTLTLSGQNTMNGTFTLNNAAGTVTVTSAGKLCGSVCDWVITAGTLNLNYTGTQTMEDLNGGGGTINLITGLTLKSIPFSTSTTNSLTSKIAGGGGFTYAPTTLTSVQTLAGANTYDGTTTISSGAITISNNTALGSTVGGTVVTSGAALNLTGTRTIGAEALSLAGTGPTGATNAGALVNLTASSTYGGLLTLTGATTINSVAGTLTLSNTGDITGTNMNLTLSGTSVTIAGSLKTGSGTVSFGGSGTLTLSGSGSNYTGQTTVSNATGKLVVGSANALGTAAGNTQITTNGAEIIFTGAGTNFTIAEPFSIIGAGGTDSAALVALASSSPTLSGPVTLTGDATIAISGSTTMALTNANSITATDKNLTLQGGSGTAGGSVSGIIALGSGNLTKLQTGTWTLSGANTYTGTTSVSAGTLSVSSIVVVSGASNLGNTSSAVVLGTSTTKGTLSYTGNADTYTRGFTVGAGGGEVDVTTSGQLLTIATGGITAGGPFTIGGAGDTTITAAITGSSGTLTKTGAGKLALNGGSSNTFGGTAGSVVISTGILSFSDGASLGAIPTNTTAGVIVINGGTLQATGTPSINSKRGIALGPVTGTGTGTFDVVSSSDVLVYGGIIANNTDGTTTGTGNLVKVGSGMLTISGSNTFSGSTTVSAGVLRVTGSNALGTTAGTTSVTSGAAVQVNNLGSLAEPITLNGTGISNDGALRNTADSGQNSTLSGAITLGSTGVRINSDGGTLFLTNANTITGTNTGLTVGGAGNTTISGIIATGSGALSKDGNGTLVLGGANTYTGGTTISGGTLQVGSGSTTGSITGDVTNNAALVFKRSDTPSYPGVISGSGTVTQQGTGTLTLSGSNSFTGAVAVNAGTLAIATVAPLGTNQPLGAGSNAITLGSGSSTGTLQYTGGANTLAFDVTVAGNPGNVGVISNTGGGTLTLSGTLTKTGTVLTFTGGAFNVTGTITSTGGGFNSDLVVNGGSLTLSSTNSYSGPTFVYGGGTLLNGVTNALPVSTVLTLGEGTGNSAGTYDLNGFIQTVAGLTNAGTGAAIVTNSGGSGTHTLTVNNDTTTSGSNYTFGGVIQNGTNALTALTKTGDKTLILTGANTYTGNTTISAGTLQIGNNGGTGSVAGDIANNAALVFNLTSVASYSGVISGTGSVTQAGTGSVQLSDNNSYQGATIINMGILIVTKLADGTNASGIGASTSNAANLVFGSSGSGTLQYNGLGDTSTNRDFTLNSTGKISVNSSGVTLTMTGVGSGSSGALTKAGAGTLVLQGANTYGGSLGTMIQNGTLVLSGGNNRLPAGSPVVLGDSGTSGTLVLGDISLPSNQTATGLTTLGTGFAANAVIGGNASVSTLTLNIAPGTNTYDGTLGSSGTGNNLALVKTGAGAVNLTAPTGHTYNGGTVVSAGKLSVNNTTGSSGTGSGAVDVNGSSAILGGNGFIDGAVTVRGGGTLAPGNSVGTITVANNVAFGNATDNGNAGSKGTFHVQIGSTTTSDQLVVTGGGNYVDFITQGADNTTPTLTSVDVDFTPLAGNNPFTLFQTYSYTIALTPGLVKVNGDGTGALSQIVINNNYAATFPSIFDAHPADFSLSRVGNNLQLDVTPVPEPLFVTAIFAAGLGGAAWLRRRRIRATALAV
jgi:fibronectin-binding autotransporter adhesin